MRHGSPETGQLPVDSQRRVVAGASGTLKRVLRRPQARMTEQMIGMLFGQLLLPLSQQSTQAHREMLRLLEIVCQPQERHLNAPPPSHPVILMQAPIMHQHLPAPPFFMLISTGSHTFMLSL